jgi:Pentapeptide repeats (9 copies)
MDREESIALFLQGRGKWNAWAEKMLAERKGLEADGSWEAAKDWRGALEPRNEKTRAWLEAAKADFTDAGFEVSSWPKMKLAIRPVELEAARVDFEGFVFPAGAVFERVTFTGDANFKQAVFTGTASFDKATFSGEAQFQRAIFLGPASFAGAAFSWHSRFEGAAFPAGAWFTSAYFRRTADFERIVADGAFSLAGARFEQTPPSFVSARLAVPPDFSKMQISPGAEPGLFVQSVLGGFFLWLVGQLDSALGGRYRVLRHLAAQTGDHKSEALFTAAELRSRRYTEDQPWHAGFWLSIIYELVANFGRSVVRPIFWLIALTAVSSWFYLAQHAPAGVSAAAQLEARLVPLLPEALRPAAPALPKLACKAGDGDPGAAAIQLAVRQALVIGGLDSGRNAAANVCLYGYDEKLRAAAVPDAAVLWGIVQTLLSAGLWFLFLLGLRNRFRIK